MYVLIVEHRNTKSKTDKWNQYTKYMCNTKKDLNEHLNDAQWVSNDYKQYRLTYYTVNLDSAVTVQSKVVHEEVK